VALPACANWQVNKQPSETKSPNRGREQRILIALSRQIAPRKVTPNPEADAAIPRTREESVRVCDEAMRAADCAAREAPCRNHI